MKWSVRILILGLVVLAGGWIWADETRGRRPSPEKVMDIKEREPSGRRREQPRVTALGEAQGPLGSWRAQLIEDSGGAKLKFIIGDRLYSFSPIEPTETFSSGEVISLEGNRSPLFVAQWNFGRAMRIYVINPALYPRNRLSALLWTDSFDGIVEVTKSEDGSALRIVYLQMIVGPPVVDQVHAEYEEKVRVWRPDR